MSMIADHKIRKMREPKQQASRSKRAKQIAIARRQQRAILATAKAAS